MSALEAELTNALEDTAQLENRNSQLSQQLCELREKASITSIQEVLWSVWSKRYGVAHQSSSSFSRLPGVSSARSWQSVRTPTERWGFSKPSWLKLRRR